MTWNTHNGTWGAGMVRAFYPASMGGPLGRPGQQLPDFNSNPAYNTERMLSSSTPYTGSGMVIGSAMRFGGGRSVTPGGMGVSPSWGLTHKFSSRKVRRKTRKSRKARKSRRKARKSRSKASRRSFGFGACMKCTA
jgi:hypothetical protein